MHLKMGGGLQTTVNCWIRGRTVYVAERRPWLGVCRAVLRLRCDGRLALQASQLEVLGCLYTQGLQFYSLSIWIRNVLRDSLCTY